MFTIPNTLDGFNVSLANIKSISDESDKIKVGLEATGQLWSKFARIFVEQQPNNLCSKSVTYKALSSKSVPSQNQNWQNRCESNCFYDNVSCGSQTLHKYIIS